MASKLHIGVLQYVVQVAVRLSVSQLQVLVVGNVIQLESIPRQALHRQAVWLAVLRQDLNSILTNRQPESCLFQTSSTVKDFNLSLDLRVRTLDPILAWPIWENCKWSTRAWCASSVVQGIVWVSSLSRMLIEPRTLVPANCRTPRTHLKDTYISVSIRT